jgi:hypothetical protein
MAAITNYISMVIPENNILGRKGGLGVAGMFFQDKSIYNFKMKLYCSILSKIGMNLM